MFLLLHRLARQYLIVLLCGTKKHTKIVFAISSLQLSQLLQDLASVVLNKFCHKLM